MLGSGLGALIFKAGGAETGLLLAVVLRRRLLVVVFRLTRFRLVLVFLITGADVEARVFFRDFVGATISRELSAVTPLRQ